jgi:hypothetical protein
MNMESLYPWHQVAWDISAAEGMTDYENLTGFKQKIANDLCADILAGVVECWTSKGDPLQRKVTFENLRTQTPHLTAESANTWLKVRGYLYLWNPQVTWTPDEKVKVDFSKLATREELLEAFGKATEIKKTWFSGNYSPYLDSARVIKGKPGKNGFPALYCPMMVMMWLVEHKKGKKLSEKYAWNILEARFPNVFADHALADPR